MAGWQEIAAQKKQEQAESIPKEWAITQDPNVLDVRLVPKDSGLLSAREIEITELGDVDALLQRLASGQWTSVEVTTAFYKRAIIAHQLVSSLKSISLGLGSHDTYKGELSNRDLRRESAAVG